MTKIIGEMRMKEMDIETRFGFEIKTPKEQAEEELLQEDFYKQVELEKLKIKAKRNRSFWRKIFPWKITIERR